VLQVIKAFRQKKKIISSTFSKEVLKNSVRTPWAFHACILRNEEPKPKQSLFLVSPRRLMAQAGNVSPGVAGCSAWSSFSCGGGCVQAAGEPVPGAGVSAPVPIPPGSAVSPVSPLLLA